jgi:hypothetical protein
MNAESLERTIKEMELTFDEEFNLYNHGIRVGRAYQVEGTDEWALSEDFFEPKSGIYVKVNSETKDLVFETSGEYFLKWFDRKGFNLVTGEKGVPISIIERYCVIKAFEEHGGRIAKINSEWEKFEEFIKRSG